MLRPKIKRKKEKSRVTIELEGRPAIEGYLFRIPGERIIDLLNDEREFLPIELLSGDSILVQKANIQLVEQSTEGKQADPLFSGQPGEIFEFDNGTTPEDLKIKLESILKKIHPEIVTQAKLHPALTDCARMLTTRLISSYQNALEELTRREIRNDLVKNSSGGNKRKS